MEDRERGVGLTVVWSGVESVLRRLAPLRVAESWCWAALWQNSLLGRLMARLVVSSGEEGLEGEGVVQGGLGVSKWQRP